MNAVFEDKIEMIYIYKDLFPRDVLFMILPMTFIEILCWEFKAG